MVEFLVRRERKLDVKADVAVTRLALLEKERSQLEDEEHKASLPVARQDRTKVVKLVVDKWFVDKGFGLGKVPTGEVVSIHASVVRGAEVLAIGTNAWVQVVRGDARAQGVSSIQSLETRRVETGERQGEGKQSGRASEASSSVDGRACGSVGGKSPRCAASSGLARRFGRRRNATHGSLSLVDSNPLPAAQGFSSYSGKFRGRQPWSDKRAQVVALGRRDAEFHCQSN